MKRQRVMTTNIPNSGWMIEVLSSGLDGRRRRYLVAIADRATAIAAIIHELGSDTDITSVVSVHPEQLAIAQVAPGKITAV